MNPDLSFTRDGKKFMWDGMCHATREEVTAQEESYRRDSFEVCVVEEEGKFFIYTRRVVKEVVVAPH